MIELFHHLTKLAATHVHAVHKSFSFFSGRMFLNLLIVHVFPTPGPPWMKKWILRSLLLHCTSCTCHITVCLDTSWSMAGPRENLAKAVVLECSKQGKGILWELSIFFDFRMSLWCWYDVVLCCVAWCVAVWCGWWKMCELVSPFRTGGFPFSTSLSPSPFNPFSFKDAFAFLHTFLPLTLLLHLHQHLSSTEHAIS